MQKGFLKKLQMRVSRQGKDMLFKKQAILFILIVKVEFQNIYRKYYHLCDYLQWIFFSCEEVWSENFLQEQELE